MQLSPFLTVFDFGVCAPQSASFALATTRLPDGLLNASRPLFRSDGVHCNSFNVISPLPFGLWTSAFAHRNPPRSLWLQLVYQTGCLTRRAHIAQIHVIFLLKQTSFARGEVGTRIDRDISLLMPLRFVRRLRNNTTQSLVLHPQGFHTQKSSER